MTKTKTMALVAGVFLLAAVGCSPQEGSSGQNTNIDPVQSAKAKLDYEAGTITLPLDEYDFYGNRSKAKTSTFAADLARMKCMAAKGESYPLPRDSNRDKQFYDERPYGLWNVEKAQLHGYGLAEDEANESSASEDQLPESWELALEACEEEISDLQDRILPSDEDYNTSIVTRLRTEAVNLANQDSRWSAAREGWWKCLEDQGLTPRKGASDWASEQAYEAISQIQPDGSSLVKEAEIRVAVVEATCNQEQQLSQKLGDIEAGYQQALIEQNQSALNTLKTENHTYYRAAEEYVANNG